MSVQTRYQRFWSWVPTWFHNLVWHFSRAHRRHFGIGVKV